MLSAASCVLMAQLHGCCPGADATLPQSQPQHAIHQMPFRELLPQGMRQAVVLPRQGALNIRITLVCLAPADLPFEVYAEA